MCQNSDGRNYTMTEARTLAPLVVVPNEDSCACTAETVQHFSLFSFQPTKNTPTTQLNMLLAGPRVSNPFNISNLSPIFTKISKKIFLKVFIGHTVCTSKRKNRVYT
jgi:hypothetical protein